jgi:hypothetical protein
MECREHRPTGKENSDYFSAVVAAMPEEEGHEAEERALIEEFEGNAGHAEAEKSALLESVRSRPEMGDGRRVN